MYCLTDLTSIVVQEEKEIQQNIILTKTNAQYWVKSKSKCK